MNKCCMGIIIDTDLYPGVIFRPPLQGRQSLEVPCNRTDDHAQYGEHWYQSGQGAKISWNVEEGGIWMADADADSKP